MHKAIVPSEVEDAPMQENSGDGGVVSTEEEEILDPRFGHLPTFAEGNIDCMNNIWKLGLIK